MSEDIDLEQLAQKTEGFSGSDLRELCRNAMIYRVRDYVRSEQLKAQFNALSNNRWVKNSYRLMELLIVLIRIPGN